VRKKLYLCTDVTLIKKSPCEHIILADGQIGACAVFSNKKKAFKYSKNIVVIERIK